MVLVLVGGGGGGWGGDSRAAACTFVDLPLLSLFQTGPPAERPAGLAVDCRQCSERAPPSGGRGPLDALLPICAQRAPLADPPGAAG